MQDINGSLPFFPSPADGEIVFSLLCRYSKRSGLPDTHILRELTGQRWATSLLSPLPGYLRQLSQRIPHGHSWRSPSLIALSHTALPYFTYFDSQRDRHLCQQRLANCNSSQPLAMALGLTSYRRTIPTHPRYCLACVQEDRDTLGFSCFRREHQLPGVLVCVRHGSTLAHGCTTCGTYPINDRALSMAGKCLCEGDITPLPIETVLPDEGEPLLWLARESAFLVNSAGTRVGNIRERLRIRALEQGLGRGSLLDYNKLADAIAKRFGRETLQLLMTPAWENDRPAAWVRRLLCGQPDPQKRSPTLFFLLFIGTLSKSVEEFEQTRDGLTATKATAGISLQSSLGKPAPEAWRPAWSHELHYHLQNGKCGLPGISKRLGVSTYRLIEEIRRNGWRVPLSPQTRKKLGEETIGDIRNDLRQGKEKTEIMRRLGSSEWALTLIELDEPGINATFRNAARLNTREVNRNRLRQYLSKKPAANRTDVLNDLPGVYDYLIKNDKAWFYEQLPKRKVAPPAPRGNRVDWTLLDHKKAIEIASVFDAMLGAESKPVHATATAALKRVGLLRKYHNYPEKFPRVAKILQHRLEERPQFVRRRLAWAVEQMAEAGAPISINKLRRVAALPAHVLREHRQEVIDLSEKLKAELDRQSYFFQR